LSITEVNLRKRVKTCFKEVASTYL